MLAVRATIVAVGFAVLAMASTPASSAEVWSICANATKTKPHFRWDDSFGPFGFAVKEAKRRGLSLADCARHLGVQTSTSPSYLAAPARKVREKSTWHERKPKLARGSTSVSSAEEWSICANATKTKPHFRWDDSFGPFGHAVAKAKRHGLSLADCASRLGIEGASPPDIAAAAQKARERAVRLEREARQARNKAEREAAEARARQARIEAERLAKMKAEREREEAAARKMASEAAEAEARRQAALAQQRTAEAEAAQRRKAIEASQRAADEETHRQRLAALTVGLCNPTSP